MVKQPVQRGFWFHVLDVVFNIAVIVVIVTVIRTFLVSPFKVEGNSMVSTLEDHEYIVINKLAYIVGDPQRGDIVVFRPPNEPGKYYVKRVIGVPGDAVYIRNGSVYVTPKGDDREIKLEEPYLDEHNRGNTYPRITEEDGAQTAQYVVPDGEYFLLGDNRQGSHDSRSFRVDGKSHPFVPDSSIKGRVWFVILPITKIHAFSPPDYDDEPLYESQE